MLTGSPNRQSPGRASSGRGAADISRVDWIAIQAPARSVRRYRAIRAVLGVATRLYSKVRVEGMERLPAGPAVLCFSHQNWADPFFILAVMPNQPRTYFFGPEQEEMRRGFRNRLMRWGGVAVPYRPGRRGLVATTARAEALLGRGAIVAIAGEGRIHAGERIVLPLEQGPAYLSLRAGVPLAPVAINGTSWLGFRRVVRVRVGLPIAPKPGIGARPNVAEVARVTAQAQSALEALVADFPDRPRSGRIGRCLTELFNDWPEGARPPVQARNEDAATN
ncbi:MAG TPA: 1-acyl-sn-glycerol-3-phosphate acyltransferase [Candidatus Limnocylindrales bacterium]